MDKNKRHFAEGLVNKASAHLQTAKDYRGRSAHTSDAVQAAQVCVELSVKAILTYLEVQFSKSHGWENDKLGKLAEQIQHCSLPEKLKAHNVFFHLPRLIFLANFWNQFYLLAKYGMETGHLASAQDLFGSDEAEIALKHAEECYHAALMLKFLPDD